MMQGRQNGIPRTRQLILIIMAVSILSIATMVEAIDTTLTSPITILSPATKIRQTNFTIIPSENKVRTQISFLDANGQEVQTKECEFTDPAVTNAVITSVKVGQKYIDVLQQAIQNKCKGLWNITGTDAP